MRWVEKPYSGPKLGTTRTKSGFLLLPRYLPGENGLYVFRWLEKATWEQEWSVYPTDDFYQHYWKNIRWLDC
jgi:hypothetical protein